METETAEVIEMLDKLEEHIVEHRRKAGLRPCGGCTHTFKIIKEKVRKLHPIGCTCLQCNTMDK